MPSTTGGISTEPQWHVKPLDAATPGKRPEYLRPNLCHEADVEGRVEKKKRDDRKEITGRKLAGPFGRGRPGGLESLTSSVSDHYRFERATT